MDNEERYTLKVIVAEDEDLIRTTLVRKIMKADPAVMIVGAAQDGKEALAMIADKQPDVLVTDIRMPIMDGMELIRTVHHHYPRLRVIITSGYAEFDYARQALHYHVSEYLLKPVNAEELKQALLRVRAAIESEQAGEQDRLRSLHQAGLSSEETVQLVQRYIRDNFRQELSLEKIARSFNFNPSYLSKIFIKHTGEPPSKYVMALRINEAKYLLANQRHLSVKEVGERVGYADQFYFSRIFKQMTGCTPKEFQR